MDARTAYAFAVWVARGLLGLMFVFSGAYKAFGLGVAGYAQELAGNRFLAAVAPLAPGIARVAPWVELLLGLLLLLGLWTRGAAIALGGIVLLVAGAHSLTGLTYGGFGPTANFAPFVNGYILPRAALVALVLLTPTATDRYSLDRLLSRRAVPSDEDSRACALLTIRALLGLVFLTAGLNKVFLIGPLEHARLFFVEPYATSFLPVWGLWASGTVIPPLELLAGALVLVGLWRAPSLLVLGGILVFVMFGHLVNVPLFVATQVVLPRTALLIPLLLLPAAADTYSIDVAWRGYRSRAPEGIPADRRALDM
jgi:uncharacterized membrane protein YphA (DoxX/SURF4 family)